MNHLLHAISWHQYLAASFVATIIYYVVVLLHCYRPELQKLQRRLSGDKPENQLQALQYLPDETAVPAASVNSQGNPSYPQETISDTDIITAQLKACISQAAERPFAPAILVPMLQQILQQNTAISASPGRPAINHLVVNECEKTGTAMLTEDEVDQWWSV